MEIKCPNCGHERCVSLGELFDNQRGSSEGSRKDGLFGFLLICPECHEAWVEWVKVQRLGATVDDAIATIQHRFFYPAEGQTIESMVAAGVQKLGSVMKGS